MFLKQLTTPCIDLSPKLAGQHRQQTRRTLQKTPSGIRNVRLTKRYDYYCYLLPEISQCVAAEHFYHESISFHMIFEHFERIHEIF